MKKLLVLVLIAAVGAGAYFIFNAENASVVGNKTTNSALTGGNSAYKPIDSCKLLTKDIAESVLGTTAKLGDTGAGNTGSDDLLVSSCIYYTTNVPVAGYKSVSLLARSAKTNTGSKSNKSQFNENKPPGVTDVAGVGDTAYWNPEFGQLNVLVGDNWLIISSGTSKTIDRTTADAVTLANKLIAKL